MEEVSSPVPSAHRIQQSLQVILAGLEERESLSKEDLEEVLRDLRVLLENSRVQVAAAEIRKAESVSEYTLRPTMEECLKLWFGKSEQTDQEIWTKFGADVALASSGHYDHWALDVDHPRLLVALVIMLDQFRRNMYRDTPQAYACDARCRTLVKRGLRAGVHHGLQPIERALLCLVLTHSEDLKDQYLCLQEWDDAMKMLLPNDPLNVFHEIFNRHLAVVQKFGRFPHRNEILDRTSSAEEKEFLDNSSFRFDLPLMRRDDGTFCFQGTTRKRIVKMLDHEYETMLPDAEEVGPNAFLFQYNPDNVFVKTQEQLKKQGFARIGDDVPDFVAETTLGPIRFYDFIDGAWCVLFSHPADFTPVCTTEFGVTAKLHEEWKKRNVKVIGLSVDRLADHQRWIHDINDTQGVTVNFPIISDWDRRISMLFGMLDSTNFRHGQAVGQTMTVRSVFIISPAKRIELILTYPAYIGRNFNEILRTIDALQLSIQHKVATPANWRPGEDTVVLPFISDAEAEEMFGQKGGIRKVRSYLRYVQDPSHRF